MIIFNIIIILSFIIILAIIYSITKKIIKTIFIFFIITTLTSLIIAIIVFNDFNNIKENIFSKPSLIIIQENNNIVAASYLPIRDQKITNIPLNEYNKIKENFNNQNFENLLDNYFKLFIFDLNNLEAQPLSSIDFAGTNFQKNEVLGAIRSNTPKEILNIPNPNLDNNQLKISLYFSFLSEDEIGPEFLLKEYIDGNIIIYKETIIFKIIKITPYSLIERQLKKTI